uniref:Uncharacterized protein n=1 Tax=Romanomermis culicivorax TaxID=13658 RepID=A0A915KKZ8_ROMCU
MGTSQTGLIYQKLNNTRSTNAKFCALRLVGSRDVLGQRISGPVSLFEFEVKDMVCRAFLVWLLSPCQYFTNKGDNEKSTSTEHSQIGWAF